MIALLMKLFQALTLAAVVRGTSKPSPPASMTLTALE